MNAPIIQVQGLTRRYGDNHALDGIDFSASAGKVYGLVGANGAGKTTLLKHLLGLLRPQAGTVRVFGEDPVRHPARVLKRIGYLSEQRDMPEWMRIGEFLRYLQAFHPTWDMRFAYELVDTFNLDAARKISALSQGMRAQTGIIAALAHRPELLILDEPSNGLDAAVRLDIIDAVIRTVADEGRCVMFSSHLLDEMERTCDHVTMIQEGRIVFDTDLDAIKETHLFSRVTFSAHHARPPILAGALLTQGGGHSWHMVHDVPLEQFRMAVLSAGGEITESRMATLEEIFLARAGRSLRHDKAA
ncbi:MAG TPA: ABC transporter ATP-binding protein [Steroidobacteraceae bacterium]|nr:ABC transporter ATP-binding protein [Steroidobacteraceae bacterium]